MIHLKLIGGLFAVLLAADALRAGSPGTEPSVQDVVIDKKLPELRLDNSALGDVIDFLRDVSGANIFVNWRALENVGIDRTTPVSVRLRDVKFSKALQMILDDVGGGNVKLDYIVDDGVITISTDEDLAPKLPRRNDRRSAGGEYYMSGVPTPGTYALPSDRPITLRQALIAAGVRNAAAKFVMLVSHNDDRGANLTMTVPLRNALSGSGDIPLRAGDVVMVADKVPTTQPAESSSYDVEGVARPGTYSLLGRRITLLQAIVAAGSNPPDIADQEVALHRKSPEGDKVVLRRKLGEIIAHPDGGGALEPGDRLIVVP